MGAEEEKAKREAERKERKNEIDKQRREVAAKFGTVVKRWREQMGMTQPELSAKIFKNYQVVGRVERGDYPPPLELVAVVRELGGPAEELGRLAEEYARVGSKPTGQGRLVWPNGITRRQLPDAPPKLVGRDRLLHDISQALRRHRLVSLVGAAGIGKTALAAAVIENSEERGRLALLVDLSAMEPGATMVEDVALRQLLEDVTTGQAPTIPDLAKLLKDRDCIVVIDNCEHVVKAARSFIVDLLAALPKCTVLATSREPLQMSVGVILTVQPLEVPDSLLASSASDSAGTALDLFEDLIRRACNDEDLREADREHALALCRELDGVPLALELAASRARMMSLVDIRRTIAETGLKLLDQEDGSGSRHGGLTSALAWSWALLTPDERRALGRLAVSRSSMSFRCAAYVAEMEGTSGGQLVAELLDCSLLARVKTEEAGSSRVRLLHVVQMFVKDHAPPEDPATGGQRLLSWLEELSRVDEVVQQQAAVIRDGEMSLLVATVRDFATVEPVVCFRICLNLWQTLRQGGYASLGIEQLDAARNRDFQISDADRGRAFGALCNLLVEAGRHEDGLAAAKESVRIRRTLGDSEALRYALINLAVASEALGEFEESRTAVEDAEAVPGTGDDAAKGDLCAAKGILRLRAGDVELAVRLFEDAARLLQQGGADWSAAHSLRWLCLAHMFSRDLDAAVRAAEKAIDLSTPSHELQVQCRLALVMCLALDGESSEALTMLEGLSRNEEKVNPRIAFEAAAVRARVHAPMSPPFARELLVGLLAANVPLGLYWADAALWVVGAAHAIAVATGDQNAATGLLSAGRTLRRQHLGLAPPVGTGKESARRSQPQLADFAAVRSLVAKELRFASR